MGRECNSRAERAAELRELCTRVPIPNDTHNLTQLQAHSLSHTESSTQERASGSSRSQFPYVWVPLALATYPHMYDNKPVFRFHVISATNEKFKSKTQIKYICMLRKKKRYKRSKEPVTQIQIGKQKHRRAKEEQHKIWQKITNLFSLCCCSGGSIGTVGKID